VVSDMRLKSQNQWVPPFSVWEHGIQWKVYDSEEDIPVVAGSSMMVKGFITKYIPPTATIFYFDKEGIASHHGIVFRFKAMYEGVPEALKAESKELQQIEAEKRREERPPAG